MTSPVSSYFHDHAQSDRTGSSSASRAVNPPGASAVAASSGSTAAAPEGEAVTLTQDAQTSTDLLEAARAAPGIDQQAVQSVKDAIGSGTYQVPPENLAASIVAALKELHS
jgi:flagellar biosynthesis anti-sigma factor FlgM